MHRPFMLIAVALVLAGCSSGSSAKSASQPHSVTPVLSESSLASTMLLALSDFPAGWAEKARDTSKPSPFDQCNPGKGAGETGRGETGEFSNGHVASVSESIALYDTAANASAAIDRMGTAGSCVVNLVTTGKLDDNKATYSKASFSPVSFPVTGDRTTAYRYQIHVKAKRQTGFGSEADLFIDAVYVQVGRIGFAVLGSDVLTPYDTSDLQQRVTTAQQKIVAMLH